MKPTSIINIEQQRERERQRFREEEEQRRKKLVIKKDHQQLPPITAIPKFEQLVVDQNNNESSRPNKTKTPTSGMHDFFLIINHILQIVNNKPSTITPLPRLSMTNQHEENGTPNPKKILSKRRSTILVSLVHSIVSLF